MLRFQEAENLGIDALQLGTKQGQIWKKKKKHMG